LLALSLRDYGRTPGAAGLAVERSLPARLSLDTEQSVTLAISSASRQRLLMEVRDDVPDSVVLLSRFEPMVLPPGGTVEIVYRIKAVRRGSARFRCLHVRLQSGLGLVWRQFTVAAESERKMYPSFVGIDRYDLLAMIDRRQERRKTPGCYAGRARNWKACSPICPVRTRAASIGRSRPSGGRW
jgi:uncharacterized protein (DUF58 family)